MDINMDVIDIINVDLEVELFNGFLAKELEDKRKEEELLKVKLKEKQDEEIRKRKEDENYKKKLEEDKKRREQNLRKYGTKSNFVPFSGKGNRLGD